MTGIVDTEAWREFFSVLQTLPELWKIKADVFKYKHKKKIALSKLLEVYKSIDGNANEDTVKKRLQNIRSCYRRECKKVERSRKSGAAVEEEYVPTLWYFDLVKFLRDQEIQLSGTSTGDLEDGDLELPTETHEPGPSHKRRRTNDAHLEERNALFKNALAQLAFSEKPKDDASTHSESWAVSLRELAALQQICAKKAIQDIFTLGQLGALRLSTVNVAEALAISSEHSGK
ncbi:uncharacterized protein LOC119657019 [Hermetia illucens]|uniref:uncharacterized protein LOC119657019 n=1 Tax=Hermetia illucens TaxID=343691 RepID=UPI0018CC7272|nr:uncharacterized protein LOC119657019 [Hermetia illucens]